MLAIVFVKLAGRGLQVDFHRSAMDLRVVPTWTVFFSKIVETCIEIRESDGGARIRDTSGGVNNSQRSSQVGTLDKW